MKLPEPDAQLLQAATNGDLRAIDALLLSLQRGIYNLAQRMLGQRDDAADATQEILLKVVTHLGTFRGQSAFSTWVYQIARNHLLTASTRSRESPEVSLDAMQERLQAGLDLADQLAARAGAPAALTPEDKLAARQVALACTQNMLMALDREQRLAYVLDAVFELPSAQAAAVLSLTPAAYRQRVSRARRALDGFSHGICGLANPDAACHCDKQLPALRHVNGGAVIQITRHREEADEAARHFDALVRLSDAAALFRAHPEYRAPDAMVGAIRSVLRAEGYLGDSAAPLQ